MMKVDATINCNMEVLPLLRYTYASNQYSFYFVKYLMLLRNYCTSHLLLFDCCVLCCCCCAAAAAMHDKKQNKQESMQGIPRILTSAAAIHDNMIATACLLAFIAVMLSLPVVCSYWHRKSRCRLSYPEMI